MPKFPTKEAEILALAERMLKGYFEHSTDFPSVNQLSLFSKIKDYKNARNARVDAQAAALLTVETKTESLTTLRELMRDCLRKSEVDTAGAPEKLLLIGWGPRTEPQPVQPPDTPLNLRITVQGRAAVSLIWDKAAGGDEVRNYIIERRERQAGSGIFGKWTLVGSALSSETELKNQPRALQLEYRVKAANTGGESPPSNTITVVL